MKAGQVSKLLIGLIAVFALFQWMAGALGSDYGQAGVMIGLVVVAATILIKSLLFKKSFSESATEVGLKSPRKIGLLTSIGISLVMLSTIPVFVLVTGSTFSFYPEWQFLIVGLFFQAGIAEETLFRGYLFGHLRDKHPFRKAVVFAAGPFVLVHLILFYSLPWSIATASIFLAIAMSFPLSCLFELDGDSIWAPAIVHFVTQAGAKILVVSGESAWLFPFFWIIVSAIVPLSVYIVPYLFNRFGKKFVRALIPTAFSGILLVIPIIGQTTETTDSVFEKDFWSQAEMTGDWNGQRFKLREKGIDLNFRLTQYYQGNVTGGTGRSSHHSGKFDTHFRFDLEKLLGWKRLTVQIKTETRFGRTPSVGSAVPLNAGVITPKSETTSFSVTALNFTQLIPIKAEKGDFVAVGAGKYYSLDSSREPFTGGAGLTKFMNMATNGNPAVGRTVPAVSNGATLTWIRKGSPFISFAVFDPVASPTSSGFRKLFKEGITFVSGLSLPTSFGKKNGQHAFSGTITTRKFTPFDQLAQVIIPGSPAKPMVPKGGSWSLTYTFNQYLRQSLASDGQQTGWGVFGVFTVADKTTNPVSGLISLGLGGNGLFKKRQRDKYGLAYGLINVSHDLQKAINPLVQVRDEHNFETFYNFSITPWMWLTCDLQIIRPVLKSSGLAVVPGSRLVIHF